MYASNKAIVQRVVDEIINQGHLDLADELFAPHYQGHPVDEARGFQALNRDDPPTKVGSLGPDSIKRDVGNVRSAFPDVHCVTEEMIAEGDFVVARVTLTGTHEGEFQGIAATHRRFARSGIHICRVEDGQIVEQWAQSDDLGMLTQLRG